MKQGAASRTVYEPMVQPTPHRVTPARSTQYGAATNYEKDPLYKGRGFKAPMNRSEVCHKSGSQGRH